MSHERNHFRRNYDQIDESRHHKKSPRRKDRNRESLGGRWGWKHGGPLSAFRRLEQKLQEIPIPAED